MKQVLALLRAQMSELVAKNELNGRKEIRFARSVAANDDIVLLVEWVDDCLLAIGFKSVNNHLKLRKNKRIIGKDAKNFALKFFVDFRLEIRVYLLDVHVCGGRSTLRLMTAVFLSFYLLNVH